MYYGGTSAIDERPCQKILASPDRGPLRINWRAVLSRPRLFLHVFGPFLRAHHPECSQYRSHTFTFLNKRWCIGCFFNTVSFVLATVTLLLLTFLLPMILSRFYLFWSGISAMIISLLISSTRFADRFRVKAVAKILLGSGFAALAFSILLAGDSILFELGSKLSLILILYLFAITILNTKRMYELSSECQRCEYMMRWSRCPGFRETVCALVEAGFLQPAPRDSAVTSSQH